MAVVNIINTGGNSLVSLSEGVFFDVSETGLSEILLQQYDILTITIPIDGVFRTCNLTKKNITSNNFSIATSDGLDYNFEVGLNYSGTIPAIPNSLISLSFSNLGIIGSAFFNGIGYEIGQSSGRTHRTSVTNELQDWSCDSELISEPPTNQLISEFVNTSLVPLYCINVYLEIDYDIYQLKGADTANYITSLFNICKSIYEIDGITINLSQIFIWTNGPAPYTGRTGFNGILDDSKTVRREQFRDYRPTFNGDSAIFLCRTGDSGGIAPVDGLCNFFDGKPKNHCYARIFAYQTIGLDQNGWNWDVSVICHELGHNLGSEHTHACVWNGNNTRIDPCGQWTVGSPLVPSPACYNEYTSGPPPFPVKGTIMSYCHNVSGVGTDLTLGFGTQVREQIINTINSKTCLSCGSDPNVTPSVTKTNTPSPTRTATKTKTPYGTPLPTKTITITPTITKTITKTPNRTPTKTPTRTINSTPDPTKSNTPTISQSNSNTPTITVSQTLTQTITVSHTLTKTPTVTSTNTKTPTKTPTPTKTVTKTITNTITETKTNTPTKTLTKTVTSTPTTTPTQTRTPNGTPEPTNSNTPTKTITKTISPTKTETKTPTSTKNPTRTPTKSVSETKTATPTRTQTKTLTKTIQSTPTVTPTLTISKTSTRTIGATPIPTQTNTSSVTKTPTVTPTITLTITPTLTPTITSPPCEDVYEPNNTPSTAFPISIGTPIRASLNSSNDFDFYILEGFNRNKNLKVQIYNLPAQYGIRVFRNQVLLAESTNVENNVCKVIINNTPRGGVYIIQVFPIDVNQFSNSCYTLQASLSPLKWLV